MDKQPVVSLTSPDFEELLQSLLEDGAYSSESLDLVHKQFFSDSFGSWFEADAGMDAD